MESYPYRDEEPCCAQAYILPVLKAILDRHAPPPRRLLDLGCGNGATARVLAGQGYEVLGIDSSDTGVQIAREACPEARFEAGSAYDDLPALYGTFPLVLSLEVVEHLYSPRQFAETLRRLLEPGGLGVVSTPYHGYLKNLALAVTNRMDFHYSPLWEGGHIKFWSIRTLGELLSGAGFVDLEFHRAGRIPPLAKSIVVSFRRGPDR